MDVNIKKLHANAVLPSYGNDSKNEIIFTSISKRRDKFDNIVYQTGVMVEIPKGYVGLLFPEDTINDKDLILSNSIGVVQFANQEEITFKFTSTIFDYKKEYNVGDRVGKMVILPCAVIDIIHV